MSTATDHLVVVARTLEQGAAWCKSTFGVEPGLGGRHTLMGTHNRLLAIGSPMHPNAYLEIIAVDPDAPSPARARWFGMDDAALQAAVREAPRFVHVVARTPHEAAQGRSQASSPPRWGEDDGWRRPGGRRLQMLRRGLINLGLDPGVLVAAQRDTPQGRLAWRILLRDDGLIDRDFALPTLIEWQGHHPAEAMPATAVRLQSVQAGAMPARLAALLQWRGVVHVESANPRWRVTLQSPAGDVTLNAWPEHGSPATTP